MAVRPLASIKILGKKGTEEPFKIVGHRDSYFYISANTLRRLLMINDDYIELCRGRVETRPVRKTKTVWRGGAIGFKSFLLGGERYIRADGDVHELWRTGTVRGERYLCIRAEDLKLLRAVNEAYRELLRRKRAKVKSKAR